MPRISQAAVKLYRQTIDYFKELITNTATIMQLPPRQVIESLALELLDDDPKPHIEDVEWNFENWPFKGMSRNE